MLAPDLLTCKPSYMTPPEHVLAVLDDYKIDQNRKVKILKNVRFFVCGLYSKYQHFVSSKWYFCFCREIL